MNNKIYVLLVVFFLAGCIYQQYFVPDLKELSGDAVTYDSIAKNLIENGQYSIETDEGPTVRRAPLYPIFLTIIYLLFGYNYHIVQIIQLLLLVVGGYFLTHSIKLLSPNNVIPFLGLLLYMAYFPLLYYTSLILTEILFTTLMIIFSFYLIKSIQFENQKDIIKSGLILGFITLCKPVTLLLPIFIIMISFFIKNKKFETKSLILVALISYATILPWSIRNYIITNELVPITSGSGIEFWMTTDPDMPMGNPWSRIPVHLKESNLSELEMDSALIEEGVKNIINNPLIYIRNMNYNFVRFWTNLRIGNPNSATNSTLLFLTLNLSLIVIFIIGLFKNNYFTDSHIILLSIVLYFSLLYTVFGAAGRFSIPIIPYLIIFSSYGVYRIFLQISPNSKSTAH